MMSVVQITVLILSIVNFSSALFPQYALFYPFDYCKGPQNYTFKSIANFEETAIEDSAIAFSGRGAWILKHYRTSDPDDIQTTPFVAHGALLCYVFSMVPNNKFKSLELVLDEDLEYSSIAFFPNASLWGEGTKISKLDEFSLSAPISIGSYVFTGIRSWTVFDQPGFGGNATCLEVSKYGLEDGFQITWGNSYLNVGSGHVGCVGQSLPKLKPVIFSQPSSDAATIISSIDNKSRVNIYL